MLIVVGSSSNRGSGCCLGFVLSRLSTDRSLLTKILSRVIKISTKKKRVSEAGERRLEVWLRSYESLLERSLHDIHIRLV